jgi:hypothetical protein
MKWKWIITIVGNDIFIKSFEVEAENITQALWRANELLVSNQKLTIEKLEIGAIEREDIT